MRVYKILELVAETNGITADKLDKSNGRDRSIVKARFQAMWALRKYTKMSTYEIASELGYEGKRRHCAVLHGIKTYNNSVDLYKEVREEHKEFVSNIGRLMTAEKNRLTDLCNFSFEKINK